MKLDPRARQLAEVMHELARQKATKLPAWPDLSLADRDRVTTEARLWLHAAVEIGVASAPSDNEAPADEAAPPLPSAIRLGTQWCWDPLYPHLRCRVRIVDTRWDGALWWVKTEALSDSGDRRAGNQRLHTLDRFIESTVAVDDV